MNAHITEYGHRRWTLKLAVLFQIGVLLSLAVPPVVTLHSGKAICVETVPVDPWNMFRGDYIRLGYDFGRVTMPNNVDSGEPVYVTLGKDETGKWQVTSAGTERPAPRPGQVVLRGVAEYGSAASIPVKFGIEQVFVPEGKGKRFSSADRLKVDLTVDDQGRAVIKRVRAGDEEIYRLRLI
ncbi:MAG: GDYXXLXY domain-containing protein [Cyanobacteria bacterium HKST-UBA02]|nr:GDYXXLXY domain-containing protein [Cyanobacteria bacterium HKST-UBA02]